MAAAAPNPTIGLRDRSFPLVGAEEKLSKWLVCSLLLHVGMIVALFLMPFLPARGGRVYPVYTVDLVGGERIGGANLGTRLAPIPAVKESPKKAAKEKALPAPEIKRETKKEKSEPTKAVDKPTVVAEKTRLKENAKKEAVKEKAEETKAVASLDNVRERLIQSAVDRAKHRTESSQKTSKEETISSGTGEGEGAASLGKGGRGGGVVKGMDFIIYQNRMLNTIKNNWVWVGQRSNLRVVVRFNIKDNGEIVGLKIVQPSGNPSYDESVLRAVNKSSPLPVPPEDVRKDFSEIEIAFRPEDLGA